MFEIQKDFTFSASHQLTHLKDDDHPCKRLHGHNYIVRVTLRGESTNEDGFIHDYRKLDFFKQYLDTIFDHRHLNDVMEALLGLPRVDVGRHTTAENLALFLYGWLAESEQVPHLYAVSVSETPKTWATFVGDNDG